MKLDGRDLAQGTLGADVRRLHAELRQLGFDVPRAEVGRQAFGEGTDRAIRLFQQQHDMQVTGLVDAETAMRMSAELDRRTAAVVRGNVRSTEGKPLPNLLVRALRADLKAREPLGEAVSDDRGAYRITYDPRRQPTGLVASVNPALVVRVFSRLGASLATSPPLFSPPAEAQVDLVVAQTGGERLSDYDALLAALLPEVESMPLADIGEAQVQLLSGSTGSSAGDIAALLRAIQASEQTGLLSPAVFFGLARANLPLEIDGLLAVEPADLTRALTDAIEQQVIPASVGENLKVVVGRLEQLRHERGVTQTRTAQGRLVDSSGLPLASFAVRVRAAGPGAPGEEIDATTTAADGRFAFVYVEPRVAPDTQPPERRFVLQVSTPDGRASREVEIVVTPDRAPFELAVPLTAEPRSPRVRAVAEQLNLDLPESLLTQLSEQGIDSLDDLRRAGGLEGVEGLPPLTDGMRALQAHARLSVLPGSVQTKERLIDAGYRSADQIANAPRSDFVTATADSVGDFQAFTLHALGRRFTDFMDDVITDSRVANWEPGGTPPRPAADLSDDLVDLFPASCNCETCASAIGPLAYLADLLSYASRSIQTVPQGANAGAELTVDDLADLLHQPFNRLPAACSEVERRVRQVRICVEVLRRFLDGAGLPNPGSPDQTALIAAVGRYVERAYAVLTSNVGTSLAELRAIRAADEATRRAAAERLGLGGEHLDRLDALALGPQTLNEESLESLFGLPASTRDPLSPLAAPALLIWRSEHLRERWIDEDDTRDVPIVDPDLIGPEYLRQVGGGPAFALWQARTDELAQRATAILDARAAAQGDANWLDTVFPDALGLPTAQILDLAARRAAGQDINADLAALHLSSAGFTNIVRLRRIADAGALLDGEAGDIVNILVQAGKLNRAAAWRQEERDQNVNLGPVHFIIPEGSVTVPPASPRPLPAFRATEADLRQWRATLQARSDEDTGIAVSLQLAVEAAETDALPLLRDALVRASGESADALGFRLLIDCQTSGHVATTRVAQAIETTQALLWTVRTRQLVAVHPDLELVVDDFDTAWTWLGSYESWRAAMLVFLYPENVLWPALRPRQTAAFRRLVGQTRTSALLTPGRARDLAATYQDYFRDIATLEVGASCRVTTRWGTGASRNLLFIFARSDSKRVYWSAYDPEDETGYAQSFWEQVPNLGEVDQVVGASCYRISPSRRFIYLFVTVEREGRRRILYTRFDLEARSDNWDDEPTPVQVKDDATDFKVVLKQAKSEVEPPEVAIEIRIAGEPSEIYRGPVVPTEDSPAGEVRAWLRVPTGNAFYELVSITSWGTEDFLMFLRLGRDLHVVSHFGGAQGVGVEFERWHGAICWPGEDNLVYAFSDDGQRLRGDVFWGDLAPVNERATFTPAQLDLRDTFAPHSTGETIGDDMQLIATYHRADPDGGSFRARLQRKASRPFMFALRPTTQTETSRPLTLAMLRMDNGLSGGPRDGGIFVDEPDPVLPPDPPPDPPAPADLGLDALDRIRVAPLISEPLDLSAPLAESQAQLRRLVTALTFQANADGPASNLTYLEEAYYFIPTQLGLQLQRGSAFTAALDWFRTVFDFGLPPEQRKLYFGLKLEESLEAVYDRVADWLLDPLTPHAIASVRRNAYTRFTVLSLVRCLLAYADQEFTRDSAESVARARLLYATALDLLGPAPELRDTCATLVDGLDEAVTDEVEPTDPDWRPIWDRIRDQLLDIEDRATVQAAVEDMTGIWGAGGRVPARLAAMASRLERAHIDQPRPPTLTEVIAEGRGRTTRAHALMQRSTTLLGPQNRVAEVVGNDLRRAAARITGLSPQQLQDDTVALPWVRERLRLLRDDEIVPRGASGAPAAIEDQLATLAPLRLLTATPTFSAPFKLAAPYRFCIPANPVPEMLRQHAELNIYKLRTGRNIAGDERELPPYAASINPSGGLVTGLDDPLTVPGAMAFAPTPYRYAVLIDRGKQLVGLAQQMEGAFLSAMEKRDSEAYNLLKARQDIELARAGVRLQDLRVLEAQHGVTLARLQQHRASIQLSHYQRLLDEGVSEGEAAGALAGSVGAGIAVGATVGGAYGAAAGAAVGLAVGIGSLWDRGSSYERRREEWQLARALAWQDVRIGDVQTALANDYVRIVNQERAIGLTQAEHAAATAEFLANKFTSFELYDWMSIVLEDTYRYFLLQATAVARLAAGQLAFERQQVLPSIIQADYWDPLSAAGFGEDLGQDRRGLTGSARLLQDIFQLDQYAFDTDRRKHQLSRTISLSQLAPVEFQRFRETGVLPFSTPMDLFDRDFPGHYLRLIKRVRLSMIALIPPVDGIKATLAGTGISRAVIPVVRNFSIVDVRRPPESIALTSPRDATGLFDLSPQLAEMLLPFEGLGVDTSWLLEVPRAANLFDYSSIADVLVTIEYTALESGEYRQEVVHRLDRTTRLDRVFSFRHNLPDQWFDLHNPDQTPTPMTVSFTTTRQDFPPNLDDLRIGQIVLYFSRREGETFEVDVNALRFTEDGGAAAVGGPASSVRGVISTRGGNAANWVPMIGRPPLGEWELSLPDTAQLRQAFAEELLEDLLIVITYSGQTPPWPN